MEKKSKQLMKKDASTSTQNDSAPPYGSDNDGCKVSANGQTNEFTISSSADNPPPSFAESEFHHIQKRLSDRRKRNVLKWSSVPSRYPNLDTAWEFAGWGSTYYLELEPSDLQQYATAKQSKSLIGQWRATSIAGNDLVASVLYSVGPCLMQAGKYGPISMFLVVLLMYPMKRIITEVSTSLPLNGGTYSAMLNTTSKWVASVAACLCILDYLATCVVSASTASAYLAAEVTLPSAITPFIITIIILVGFSLICLLGLRESSSLALSIFTLHVITMIVVIVTSIVAWAKQGNTILVQNWKEPIPQGTNPVRMIFQGFCIGLLGVTGIESAENYIEDMRPDTFPKVMNNMFGLLSVLNTPMTLLVTALVPMSMVPDNSATIISLLGQYAAGGNRWLRMWIMIDAVIVLCAGVLTGLVGAVGLVQRLASILSTYAVVNILMKYKRGRLLRIMRVSLPISLVTLGILVTGLVGNIVIAPSIAEYFIIYFLVVLVIVLIMLKRGWLFRLAYWLFGEMAIVHRLFPNFSQKTQLSIQRQIQTYRKQPFVFFLKTDEAHVMNKAIQYVKKNEDAAHVKFVHIYNRVEDIPEDMEFNHRMLDEIYPKIQIDLMFIQGTFDPATVDTISRQLDIPKSFMFMTCPGKDFSHRFGDFNGVRIIML
ncbi:hypothetical protein EC973_003488 [Apophysomyces ossiformis]|uniref:Uncharacterized protein n=1 Tax=Apophysomyces ossiformis TaxID=679940 RepID=A0A8H7BMJ0_9FUNG|nr:hypothetical protein EC973_003488 [Apophysomyces ossiformis]